MYLKKQVSDRSYNMSTSKSRLVLGLQIRVAYLKSRLALGLQIWVPKKMYIADLWQRYLNKQVKDMFTNRGNLKNTGEW